MPDYFAMGYGGASFNSCALSTRAYCFGDDAVVMQLWDRESLWGVERKRERKFVSSVIMMIL